MRVTKRIWFVALSDLIEWQLSAPTRKTAQQLAHDAYRHYPYLLEVARPVCVTVSYSKRRKKR